MTDENKRFSLGAWDEFTHWSNESRISNQQVFENYKIFCNWIGAVSKNELIERGWVKSANDTVSIARLFFALNREQNNALFRKSASADESLLSMWLSLVRNKAEEVSVSQQVASFRSIAPHDLRDLARLSVDVNAIKELPFRLAKRGIILVYLRGLTGMRLDGAAFRLPSGHMVIGMAFRFPRLDYFWFTLMHELAHLVLHEGVMDRPFVTDIESESSDVREKAANKLAKESFVDKTSWRNCEPKYQSGNEAVTKYSRQQGIHPSIVAGLLRKELGNYSRYSEIINEYNVREIIFGK